MGRTRNSLAVFEDLQVRLSTRLGNSERRNTPRVITIMSCRERQGVTTVAVGLAAVFAAKTGSRVLFVNLASQRNGWDKKLALTRLEGIDQLNNSEMPAEFAVYRSGRYGFDVMDVGLGVDGDGRQACERILGSYPAYRIVLVDAGSLRSGAPYHFNEISTQVVLVVDAARTTTPMLERQKKDMDAVDFKFDWVILNRRRFYIPRLFYPMVQ
jgi:MinD-like ATPase involved in chromosome partitioning or flagellar assembly